MADAGNGGPLHPNAAPFAPLNFDILVTVMSFVEKKSDLLSAMCTCRALYEAGIPLLLLSNICICYKDLPQLHQFLKQREEDLTRYHALRSLHLALTELNEGQELDQNIRVITDILENATNLERLKFRAVLPLASHIISLATASLTKLRYLDLNDDWNEEANYILSNLQCPLETVKMWCVDEEDGTNVDPIQLLSKFRNTLKTVMIRNIVTIEPPPGLRFPNTTRLVLRIWKHPMLPPFIETFPNIKVFEVTFRQETPQEGLRMILRRHENIACQSGWQRSLTSLKGDILGLYIMGFQHEIESLTVRRFDTSQNAHLTWLRSVLEPLRPEYLCIEDPRNASGLSGALTVGLGRLERFDLHLQEFQPGMLDNYESIDLLLVALRVASSKLRMLCYSVHQVRSEDVASARRFMEYFANRAAGAIPTLRAMKLEVWDHPISSRLEIQSYYDVYRDDGRKTFRLKTIPPDDRAARAKIDTLGPPGVVNRRRAHDFKLDYY